MSCDIGKATEGLENELWCRWSDGNVGKWALLTYVTWRAAHDVHTTRNSTCECVCVFQCQPTALLCASGSTEDEEMALSVVYFRITHRLGRPHYVWDEYLYSVLEKVEVRVTVSVTVCVVLLCCMGWWWKEGRVQICMFCLIFQNYPPSVCKRWQHICYVCSLIAHLQAIWCKAPCTRSNFRQIQYFKRLYKTFQYFTSFLV